MPQATVTVREATPTDQGHIVGFQQRMALETEGKSLDVGLLELGVASVFQSRDKGFYLVAEADDQVVGSLLITYEWSDWRNANFWWVQSVYVDAPWRRRGVYRAMHAYIHGIANSRDDICGVRLYVERSNHVAQRTYDSMGMSRSHYDMYETDFVL
jgi:GNAT superfamily N-acetyltransferase